MHADWHQHFQTVNVSDGSRQYDRPVMASVVLDCFVSTADGAGATGWLPGGRLQGPLSPWKAHLAL